MEGGGEELFPAQGDVIFSGAGFGGADGAGPAVVVRRRVVKEGWLLLGVGVRRRQRHDARHPRCHVVRRRRRHHGWVLQRRRRHVPRGAGHHVVMLGHYQRRPLCLLRRRHLSKQTPICDSSLSFCVLCSVCNIDFLFCCVRKKIRLMERRALVVRNDRAGVCVCCRRVTTGRTKEEIDLFSRFAFLVYVRPLATAS